MVPLKILSNFWKTIEMPLINLERKLIFTWLTNWVITNSTRSGMFAIADAKRYVPVVTLSTQDNTKLLEHLKSRFKRTIYKKKYQLLIRNIKY